MAKEKQYLLLPLPLVFHCFTSRPLRRATAVVPPPPLLRRTTTSSPVRNSSPSPNSLSPLLDFDYLDSGDSPRSVKIKSDKGSNPHSTSTPILSPLLHPRPPLPVVATVLPPLYLSSSSPPLLISNAALKMAIANWCDRSNLPLSPLLVCPLLKRRSDLDLNPLRRPLALLMTLTPLLLQPPPRVATATILPAALRLRFAPFRPPPLPRPPHLTPPRPPIGSCVSSPSPAPPPSPRPPLVSARTSRISKHLSESKRLTR